MSTQKPARPMLVPNQELGLRILSLRLFRSKILLSCAHSLCEQGARFDRGAHAKLIRIRTWWKPLWIRKTYFLFICRCLKLDSFWLAGLMIASDGDT